MTRFKKDTITDLLEERANAMEAKRLRELRASQKGETLKWIEGRIADLELINAKKESAGPTATEGESSSSATLLYELRHKLNTLTLLGIQVARVHKRHGDVAEPIRRLVTAMGHFGLLSPLRGENLLPEAPFADSTKEDK